MPKKSKSSKKPVKKAVKKVVKPKKAPQRKNPNQSVRRIPAVVGQSSRANITQVVAPSGSRGGKDSYKKRSKEEIQAEKIANAEALLGLSQQKVPSTRKVFANVKPPDLTKYGGYTGLTSGYGIKENKTKELDSKLKNMEQRILNEVKKQSNPKAVNKKDIDGRTNTLIQEVSSRKITPPKPPTPALVASQLRARKKHEARFERYGKSMQTDEQRSKDELIERKAIEEQAKKDIRKSENEELRFRTKQQNTNMVSSILDNIVGGAVDITEEKKKEERISSRKRDKAERDRAIQQKQQLDLEDKEKRKKDLEKSSKEEDVRPATGFQQQLIPEDIISEFEERSKAKSIFGEEARTQQKIGEKLEEIQETQEDIEGTTQQLIEELDDEDDEEFEDVQEDKFPIKPPAPSELTIPSFVENPTPAQPQLQSRSNTQGTQTAINQGRSGGLANRAREIAENRKIPLADRPKTAQFEIDKKRKEDNEKRLRDEAEKLRKLMIEGDKKRTEEEKAKEHEKEIQLHNRQRREEERKKIDIERKRRGEAKLKRDRLRSQSTASALSIIEQIGGKVDKGIQEVEERKQLSKETAQDIVGGALQRGTERERLEKSAKGSGARQSGQGRKQITDQEIMNRWARNNRGDIPDEMRNALSQKNTLEDEKKRILGYLFGQGINGKLIDFNARDLIKVQSQREDTEMKKLLKVMMKQQADLFTPELQTEIMEAVNELLQVKYDLRKQQNKLRKYNP